MPQNRYIIYAIIAVGIFTLYMAVVNLFRADRMQSRVRNASDVNSLPDLEDDDRPSPLAVICEKLVQLTGGNTRSQKELTLLMSQAGLSSPHAVVYFMFFKRFIQPVFFLAGAWYFLKLMAFSVGTTMASKLITLMISLLLMTIGLFGASLYVNNRKQNRQQVLLSSSPEVLDLMLVCIESGLGLDAALARVCGEMKASHPIVTSELERTRFELTLMSDRVQALQNLAERTEILPFKSLVSALIQTEKFGTSLVDTLRVLSEDQRTARLLNAENRAARIPVLITIPLILCILPSFMIIILGPPLVKVMAQGGIFGHASSAPPPRH